MTFGLSLALTLQFKKKGLRTSAVQWFFWLTLSVCQGFTFGSVINNPLGGMVALNAADGYLLTTQYACVVAIFLLNCFVDAQPEYKDPKGMESLSSMGTMNHM